MKNLLYRAFFLSLACIIGSCSPTTTDTSDTTTETVEEEASSMTSAYVVSTKDTISIDTFNAWISNWDTHGRAWLDTASLIAFTMPLVDLSEVGSENGVAESRFYLGLQREQKKLTAKMMLVGVDSMNQDMTNYAKGEYVYDLSKACPPYCNQ